MQSFVTSSGLRVESQSLDTKGVCSVAIWVGVGSADENARQRGMAHFVEHMIFKGSPSVGPGELAKRTESYGGDINAYTSFDRTVYYLNILSHHLHDILEPLVESVFLPSFHERDFDSEKEVILEEIKRSNDKPSSQVGQKLFRLAYSGQEAERPIIGFSEEVKDFDVNGLKSFHDKFYNPENAVLVITGDLEIDKLKVELNKIDSLLCRGASQGVTEVSSEEKPYRRIHPISPIQFKKDSGFESCHLQGDFSSCRMDFCFGIPPITHEDIPLLDIAALVLGGSEASRLVQQLKVENSVVSGISASLFAPSFEGIFSVSVSLPYEKMEDALKEICRIFMEFAGSSQLSDEEFERAKNCMLADRIYQDELAEGRAKALGFGAVVAGKGPDFDEYYDNMLARSTKDMVTEAFRRYFRFSQLKLVSMISTKQSPVGEQLDEVVRSFMRFEQDVKSVVSGTRYSATDKKVAELSRPNLGNRPAIKNNESSEGSFYRVELDCGAELIYHKKPHTRVFGMSVASHGGQRYETEEDFGIYQALSSALGDASERFHYGERLSLVEHHAASFGGFSGKDSVGLSLECLTASVDDLLPVYFDCLKNPVFYGPSLDAYLQELSQVLISSEDSPASKAVRAFSENLFGPSHPYGRTIYGGAHLFDILSVEKYEQVWKKVFEKRPFVISATSGLDFSEVSEKINAHLQDVRFQPKAQFEFSKGFSSSAKKAGARHTHLELAREQTHVVFGYEGVSWYSKDRAACDVVGALLGGQGGRLFMNLREDMSLAYEVSPVSSMGVLGGATGAYIACSPEKKEKAVDGIRREFERLTKERVPADELERAKSYILGQHFMDLQRSSSLSMTMALMELYGLGYDDFERHPENILALNEGDLLETCVKYFDVAREWVVSCGPR